MEPIVSVKNLGKSYGPVEAVQDISFSIQPGTVFCLVGPNGAGKTTTVECLEGLRTPDRGEVNVLGMNPLKEREKLFLEVGVQLQDDGMSPLVRVKEILGLFADMYAQPFAPDDLLQEFGLLQRASAAYKNLSGGEKRKLQIALALVGRPKLVILDEPTSGLDPHSRRDLWAFLHKFQQQQGLTILLTTHDLPEAEEHADTVCIVDRGQIIAQGAPHELLASCELDFRIMVNGNGSPLPAKLFAACSGFKNSELVNNQLYLYGTGDNFVTSAIQILKENTLSYKVRQANLEDLFLIVTGRNYEIEV